MKAKKKIWLSAAAIALCAALVVVVCVILFSGGENSDGHVIIEAPAVQVTRGELKLNLVREKLETYTLDSRGFIEKKVDDVHKDFSTGKDNIFGIDTNILVGPGCSFTAYMAVSNSKQSAFEYWLEIVPVNGDTLLADQMELTVEADGERIIKRTLSGGLTTVPLPKVEEGNTSRFTAKLEYLDVEDNDKTKNTTLAFDMIVHARLT